MFSSYVADKSAGRYFLVARIVSLVAIGLALSGCADHVYYVGHPYRHRDVYYVDPAPAPVVVVRPAPSCLEEGTVVGGALVGVPGGLNDYVYIGGNWYYWHPGFNAWVHAPRPYGWQPGPGARVYYRWEDHPIYHPAVAVDPGPPADAPPAYVEEGATVNGAVIVAPAEVDDYVFISGGWYYWHPGFHCWVHAVRPYGWHPAVRVHVYHSWGEHPMYHHR